ncbi:MAG: OmpA family protein [Planctomycetota bacterium]|nr:OmpA family protein [Planctomycetota bacterium]
MADQHEAHGGGGHDEHKKHKKHGGHGGGHGKHEEHEEGVPEWVVSFADNALLQMGFFVILLAMNMKPASSGAGGAPADNKQSDVGVPVANTMLIDGAIAIREAFNNPVDMNSSSPHDAPLVRRIQQKREGESRVDGPPGDKQDVQSVRPTDYHRIGGLVSFEENRSIIDAAGKRTAADVAKELKGRRSIVEVRGHTSLAEAQDPQDRGMALSFERALAVAQLLRTSGIEWEQLRLIACGAGDRVAPIARNSTEQRSNQRVEIIVTDEQLPPDPYAKEAAPGKAP